jgi:hypothetical protein
VAGTGVGGMGMELVIAAIEEGGIAWIWFTVMLVAIYVALLVTIAR